MSEKVLNYLDKAGDTTSSTLAIQLGEDHQKVVGAIKSLECLEDVITASIETVKR